MMSTVWLTEPRISETRIPKERLVGQGLEERNEVRALFLRQREAPESSCFCSGSLGRRRRSRPS